MTTARRFEAKESTTIRDLQASVRKMGATNLRTANDYGSGAAEIAFDRAGTRYVFRCQKWPNPLDNLRSAERAISYLWRALEEYGVESEESVRAGATWTERQSAAFARFFQPFTATPDDTVLLLGSGVQDWWEVLGVARNATQAEIKNAYRALAHIHHPDHGGDAETFKRLRRAYEDGLRAVGAAA